MQKHAQEWSGLMKMLQELDYKNVFKYFTEISSVPRGSGNNCGISMFLVEFAKKYGLRYVQDSAWNVIIYKDATPGYESHTPVILQGHMDMVCVKTEDSQHDFEKEGLELFLEDDLLGAKGTTLGADNGIAIAYGMALLADSTIGHPALEVVITTDEEVGLDGAKALDASLLKGRMMINLDSEGEGVVLCSCAGGLRVVGTILNESLESEGEKIQFFVSGLFGGHSGADILINRVNATILLARLLFELKENNDFLLLSMKGGEKDNAIPSSGDVIILVKPEEKEVLLNHAVQIIQKLKKEFASAEPELNIRCVEYGVQSERVIHPISFEKILFALIQAPNGVQTMSADIKGLVETSLNLGIFHLDEKKSVFHYSLRSSSKTAKNYLRDKIAYLFDFLGGSCEEESEYPAWEYKAASELRVLVNQVFQIQYGHSPSIEAIHAGLECGIISEKIPDLDIIAMGPNLFDIHTPKERISVGSAIRTFQFLENLLTAMR